MSGIPPHDEQFASEEVVRAIRCPDVTEAILQALTERHDIFELIDVHQWGHLAEVLISRLRLQRMADEVFAQAWRES